MTQPFESSSAKIIPLTGADTSPVSPAPALAPFQAQAPTLGVSPDVNASIPATHPHDVLKQLERKTQGTASHNRKKLFLYIAGGLLAWQVVVPPPLNPVGIVAAIVGQFWKSIGIDTATTERARKLEGELADLKSRKMEAEGNCTYADYLGEMGTICRNAVARRFDGQIQAMETELEAMKPKGLFQTLFGD